MVVGFDRTTGWMGGVQIATGACAVAVWGGKIRVKVNKVMNDITKKTGLGKITIITFLHTFHTLVFVCPPV
jgi:uncharacterized membrane protein